MNFLRDLFISGHVPHFGILKKVLLILSFLPIPLYLLTDIHFLKYGEWGWQILIGVMLIRPLADVFPRLGILHSLVPLRKEFGILSGLFIFIHSYAFFAGKDQNIFIEMFNKKYWAFDSALTWGILGFITAVILLITSNQLSIKILRNNWKRVQNTAYLLFFFSAIHIVLVNQEEMLEVIVPVGIVMILWLLAHFKIQILKQNSG